MKPIATLKALSGFRRSKALLRGALLALVSLFMVQQANALTIYVKADTAPYLYVWDGDTNGDWPGKLMTETTTAYGETWWKKEINATSVKFILNDGNGNQTSDIGNVTHDVYYSYDGNTTATIAHSYLQLGTNMLSDGDNNWNVIPEMNYDDETAEYSYTISRDDIKCTGTYKFKIIVDDKWRTYSGSATNIDLSGETEYALTVTDGTENNFIVDSDSKYIAYVFTAHYDADNKWYIKVKGVLETDPVVKTTKKYYLVLQPEGDTKEQRFEMDAQRNRVWINSSKRGDGKYSTRYFYFNIQDAFIKNSDGSSLADGTEVYWYIVDDEGTVWYRPYATGDDHYEVGCGGGKANFANDNAVTYENYWSARTNDANNKKTFMLKKGTDRSYTFLLDTEAAGNEGSPQISLNRRTGIEPSAQGYRLVGNFSNATGYVEMDPKQTSFYSNVMTKYLYLNGTEYEAGVAGAPTEAAADSIVYKIDIKRPANGWNGLYLDVVEADKVGSGTNWTGDNSNWETVIRPLIWLGKEQDGTALHGGLTTANSNQSLNPAPADDFTGYTFSFNATDMTYSLQFHTSLNIVGPAVAGTDGAWALNNTDNVHALDQYDADRGCYYTTLTLTKDLPFRFVEMTNENRNYNTSWGEDLYAPDETGANSRTTERADGTWDTQYYNRILKVVDNSASTTPATGTNIQFKLATGTYTVRFYKDQNIYTIDRPLDMRDYENVYYGPLSEERQIEGRGGYNFFRTWSANEPYVTPTGIDAFIVTGYATDENGLTGVTLKQVTTGFLPADKGLILASKATADNHPAGTTYDAEENTSSKTSVNTLTYNLVPYVANNTSYDEESKLTPYFDTTAQTPRTETDGNGNITAYNYLFGSYRRSLWDADYTGEDNVFTLGFWVTKGTSTSYPNAAYLSVEASEAAQLHVGTDYNMTGANSSAPCFFLFFDDIATDTDATTGIEKWRNGENEKMSNGENEAMRNDNVIYDLFGRKVAEDSSFFIHHSSLRPGLYIYRGKKIVVK